MNETIRKTDFSKTLKACSMIIVLVVISALFHFLTDGLIFTPMNVTNLVLQNSYVVILILGMLPVILTGNVDLSVGSVLAFVGAAAAILQVNYGWGTVPTLLVALALGVAAGAWNGLWISFFGIPAFIVTLASQLLFRGLTQVLLGGASIGPFDATFRWISASYLAETLGADPFLLTMAAACLCCAAVIASELMNRRSKRRHGVPVYSLPVTVLRLTVVCGVILGLSFFMASYQGYPSVLILMLVLTVGYSFLCRRTVFGRSLYAIGGNRKAAALSGVKDKKTLFLTFVNMGLMSAVAALVYAARLNAATPKAGTGFELDAIAACFVGGASVTGGAGTISGALIGCFVIAILNNGMSLLSVSADWQQLVKGLVILGAVAFDMMPRMKKGN